MAGRFGALQRLWRGVPRMYAEGGTLPAPLPRNERRSQLWEALADRVRYGHVQEAEVARRVNVSGAHLDAILSGRIQVSLCMWDRVLEAAEQVVT